MFDHPEPAAEAARLGARFVEKEPPKPARYRSLIEGNTCEGAARE